METQLHNPVPDGRVGPFARVPHLKRTGGLGYVFDARCAGCIEERDSGAFVILSQIATKGFAVVTNPGISLADDRRARNASRLEAFFLEHLEGRGDVRYEPSFHTYGDDVLITGPWPTVVIDVAGR